MTPDVFENLQPHEFLQLWDGYQWRKENEEDKLAFFTACQMSVHTKKPVSPNDLIKPLRNTVKKKKNKSDDEEYLREKFGLK